MRRQNPQSLAAILRTATEITDERAADLWTKYRGTGDPTTFNILWLWIGNRVYPVLRGLLRDDERAEDGVQAVMVELLTKRDAMPEFATARAWLRGMASNIALQMHRSDGRRAAREQRAAKPDATADDETARLIDQFAVAQALAKLPEGDRELIIRYHFERQTKERAAAEVGCDSKMFSARLAKAESRLRDLLAALGVAVGAVSSTDAVALPGARNSIAPERLAEMLARAWNATAPGGSGWTKTALVAGAVLLTGGLAVGGWALTRDANPEPAAGPIFSPPRPAPAETVARVETFQANSRRLYESEVRPKLLLVLRSLVVENGTVTEESADYYDTRTESEFAYQRAPDKPGFQTKVRFVHDRATGRTTIFLADEKGLYKQPVDPTKPIVLVDAPGILGKPITLPFAPYTRAIEAFGTLPADPRTAAEAANYQAQLREQCSRYLGTWYRQGDPKQVCKIEFHDTGPRLIDPDGFWLTGYDRFRLLPGGRIRGLVHNGSDVDFSEDRIVFPQTGDCWLRKPNAQGMK